MRVAQIGRRVARIFLGFVLIAVGVLVSFGGLVSLVAWWGGEATGATSIVGGLIGLGLGLAAIFGGSRMAHNARSE